MRPGWAPELKRYEYSEDIVTESNINNKRKAEKYLQDDWNDIIESMNSFYSGGFAGLESKFTSPVVIRRTAPFRRPFARRTDPEEFSTSIPHASAQEASANYSSEIRRAHLNAAEKRRQDGKPKRESNISQPDGNPMLLLALELEEPEVDTRECLFPNLSGDTLHVIHSMIYVPKHVPAKIIPWEDFKTAMSELDFGWTCTGGSHHRFSPRPGSEIHNSIIVAKPHPNSYFRFNQLRNIGHRFEDNFGWTWESFDKA